MIDFGAGAENKIKDYIWPGSFYVALTRVHEVEQIFRDFFVALKENIVNWPYVYDFFEFQMVNSTTYSNCGFRSQSESTQIYGEMEVPPNQSLLKLSVENIWATD